MHFISLIMILLAPIFGSTLIGQEEAPLFVKLSTEQELKPLFLARFTNENSGLRPEHRAKIEEILQFDLGHSGCFQMLARSAERELLATSLQLSEPGAAMRWKTLNALYVVKGRFQHNKLAVTVLLINDNRLISVEDLDLTGDLSKDRQQIHQLSDSIVKMVSGTSGIASTHLLYTHKYLNRNTNQWISELWECDYDGCNNRKILEQEDGYCVTPTYIPPKSGYQASAFFYVSYKNGQPKIYLAPLSGGNSQRLSQLRGNQLMPAISRQRDQIAFISDITGNPDLFLQEFSSEKGPLGKPRQIFTTHQATQGSPTFSPDGKQIAFVSNKDGTPRIYVMPIPKPETKLKDVKAQLISRANRESSAPCWSPDGKKLAFCARTGTKVRQIWIYDFETQEEWQLTQGTENKENPSWAPNSLHVVYNTTGNQNAEVYFVNLNEPSPVKVYTPLPGEKRFPAWEPRTCL